MRQKTAPSHFCTSITYNINFRRYYKGESLCVSVYMSVSRLHTATTDLVEILHGYRLYLGLTQATFYPGESIELP